MGAFDWRDIADKLGGKASDVAGDVGSAAGTAVSDVGDIAKRAAQLTFDPRNDPLLRGTYEGLYKAGSAIKSISPWQPFGDDKAAAAPAAPANGQTGPPVNITTPSDQSDFSPYMNPLAMSGFFSKSIAPFLQQISQNLGAQSAHWQNEAQQNLGRFQMPAQFKAYFGQAQPQMAQDAANVQASLMGAAATQPEFQLAMQTMGNLQKQAEQISALQAARRAQTQLQSDQKTIAGITNPNNPQT